MHYAVYSLVVILVNTIALSLDYADASSAYRKRLDMVNFVCVILFVIEMLVKMLSMGTPPNHDCLG